jgi:hypothetical protein
MKNHIRATSFIALGRTEYRTTVLVLVSCLLPQECVFDDALASNGLPLLLVASGTCITEPLRTSAHIRHNSLLDKTTYSILEPALFYVLRRYFNTFLNRSTWLKYMMTLFCLVGLFLELYRAQWKIYVSNALML